MPSGWKKKESLIPFLFVCFLPFWWYYAAFIAPRHPKRPSNVPASATLVFSQFASYWQSCKFDLVIDKDKCQIFNTGGIVLVDGIFLSSSNKNVAVPESILDIVQGGTSSYIQLKDGTFLIPEHGYEEIKNELPVKH